MAWFSWEACGIQTKSIDIWHAVGNKWYGDGKTQSNIIWEAGLGNYSPKLQSIYALLVCREWQKELMGSSTVKIYRTEPLIHVTGKKSQMYSSCWHVLILLTAWGIRELLIHDLGNSLWDIRVKTSTGKTGSRAGPFPVIRVILASANCWASLHEITRSRWISEQCN